MGPYIGTNSDPGGQDNNVGLGYGNGDGDQCPNLFLGAEDTLPVVDVRDPLGSFNSAVGFTSAGLPAARYVRESDGRVEVRLGGTIDDEQGGPGSGGSLGDRPGPNGAWASSGTVPPVLGGSSGLFGPGVVASVRVDSVNVIQLP